MKILEDLQKKTGCAQKRAHLSQQEQLKDQIGHEQGQVIIARQLEEDSVAKNFNDSETVLVRVSLMKALNRRH